MLPKKGSIKQTMLLPAGKVHAHEYQFANSKICKVTMGPARGEKAVGKTATMQNAI